MTKSNKQPDNTIYPETDQPADKAKPLNQTLFVFMICVAGAIMIKGWKSFFISMGIMPILTIAELIGMAFVPFALGGLIALILSFLLKKIPLLIFWIFGSVISIIILLIGQYRGGT
jgi:hypothetical protein